MEKEYIYNVLLKRGYDARMAQLVTEDLLQLHKSLSDYLQCWLKDESYEEDFAAYGYSIYQLQTERKMNYPAALLTMDWLLKEPEKAIESLKRKIK